MDFMCKVASEIHQPYTINQIKTGTVFILHTPGNPRALKQWPRPDQNSDFPY